MDGALPWTHLASVELALVEGCFADLAGAWATLLAVAFWEDSSLSSDSYRDFKVISVDLLFSSIVLLSAWYGAGRFTREKSVTSSESLTTGTAVLEEAVVALSLKAYISRRCNSWMADRFCSMVRPEKLKLTSSIRVVDFTDRFDFFSREEMYSHTVVAVGFTSDNCIIAE